MAQSVDVAALADRVRAGDRAAIGRAITIVESTRADHRVVAADLLARLADGESTAIRVGITGVPGVGKSTFIDQFGSMLTADGHRVAVLAVDPSSTRSHGSVLGDKTRMERLAVDDRAFIRPSPSAGTLGGVARSTREVMAVLEAAGHDVIIVETVGVGQSEVAVAEMVDTFLLLALARTGDQLQGIKKGILELADVIAVNKADGDHEVEARQAARELSGALRLLASVDDSAWRVPVLTCSGLTGAGVTEVWQAVREHRDWLVESGELARRRGEQRVAWMWATVQDRLVRDFAERQDVTARLPQLREDVRQGVLSPGAAADELLDLARISRD
ncbi:MAG: methylmalonyl Co-A mutase-associated GTPase MeaB [Candidatus Nanopelagicales bacterium]